MLDVALREIVFRHDPAFALEGVSLTFPRGAHTAIVGPPGCGASTLLRILSGELRPSSGDVVFGTRRVNELKPAHRPLLRITSELEVPGRWSVQHALVAAVRGRTLDRIDRQREYELAVDKWKLRSLVERTIRTLSSTESARLQCARIELLRPGIVVADRLLERASPSAQLELADDLYRTLRVMETTVISSPAFAGELAFSDSIVVLDRGRVVQSGSAAAVYLHPSDDAAAAATGAVNLVPVTIRGNAVESVIGAWQVDAPPFQGDGIALVRPDDFELARRGEDSDLIFGIEEAGFAAGRWLVRGLLSGAVSLRIELPRDAEVHKGKLVALRYDPKRFRLLARKMAPIASRVPTDVIPPMRETR